MEYKDIPQRGRGLLRGGARGVLNLLPLGSVLDPNPKYSPV